MENKEISNNNWPLIISIATIVLILLLGLFYGLGRMWSNSSTPENNMGQQPNMNQNINSNDTIHENATSNGNTATNNSNEKATNATNPQSINSYDNVTALEIDTLNHSLVIKHEDVNKVQVEYNNVPSNYISNLENDGTLHLTYRAFANSATSNDSINPNSNTTDASGSIIITLPQNLNLQECDIDGNTGAIRISDLEANDFDLDCGSGNVLLTNVKLHDTDINCHTGLVDISGSLSGETDIQCNKGSLNLHLTDYDNNYNMKVKKGTGELIVNGEVHDTFALVPSNTVQVNILEIEGGSGNINIDF